MEQARRVTLEHRREVAAPYELLRLRRRAAFAAHVEQLVADRFASRLGAPGPRPCGARRPRPRRQAARLGRPAPRPRGRWSTRSRRCGRAARAGPDRVVLCGMGGSSLAPEVICAAAGVELVVLDSSDPDFVRAALEDRPRARPSWSSRQQVRRHRRDRQPAARLREGVRATPGIDPRERIVVVTDPGSPLDESAPEAGLPRRSSPTPTSAAATRRSPRSAWCRAAWPAPTSPRCSTRPRRSGPPRGGRRRQPRPAARRAAGVRRTRPARQAGARRRRRRGIRRLRRLGRAAHRRVHRQGRQGHPAGRRRRRRRARTSRRARADEVLGDLRSRTSRPFDDVRPASGWGVERRRAARRPAPAVGVRHRGGRPAHRHQPLRPARRRERQGGGPRACSTAAARQPDAGVHRRRRSRSTPPRAGCPTASDTVRRRGRRRCSAQLDPDHGYVAVQAYLDRHRDADARRGPRHPRRAHRAAGHLRLGPRFLHSTGQYHKGGPATGVYLQVTGEPEADLAVPGPAVHVPRVPRRPGRRRRPGARRPRPAGAAAAPRPARPTWTPYARRSRDALARPRGPTRCATRRTGGCRGSPGRAGWCSSASPATCPARS